MKGHFHIVIAGYRYDTCFDTWLWDLGTTNADVSHEILAIVTLQPCRHQVHQAVLWASAQRVRAGLECSSLWMPRRTVPWYAPAGHTLSPNAA